MIRLQCLGCGKKLTAPDAASGKTAKRPGCGYAVQVPSEPRLIAELPPDQLATQTSSRRSALPVTPREREALQLFGECNGDAAEVARRLDPDHTCGSERPFVIQERHGPNWKAIAGIGGIVVGLLFGVLGLGYQVGKSSRPASENNTSSLSENAKVIANPKALEGQVRDSNTGAGVSDAKRDFLSDMARQIGDADPAVRIEARNALTKAGREAVPVLIGALDHHDSRVREQAIIALGDIGQEAEGAVPALLEKLLTQPSPHSSIGELTDGNGADGLT